MENDIKKILAENDLKCTPQRMAVYQALLESETHPTAEEIYTLTQDLIPSISLASIYNTLQIFLGKGIVKTIQANGEIQRYDLTFDKHHHLYCTETGTITDYHDDELTKMIKDYLREKSIPGFDVEDFEIKIKGKNRKEIENGKTK